MQNIVPEIVVNVEGLTKSYQNKNKLRENFREKINRVLNFKSVKSDSFKVLSGVSFSVRKGEVLGVMGSNGSGKSTLLKILSGITHADKGQVEIEGRVSSILEIGTGFHPDLTGTENIYFSGALLGMTNDTIRSKMDEIVEFSELSEFIDTPVKYYSSGMYVRLAFSIITALDAEVIILDEVMAVGDTAFSLKSFDKIRRLSKSGKTIILVSHDPTLVSQICNRCIVLKNGTLVAEGVAADVVSGYIEEAFETNQQRKNQDQLQEHIPKSRFITSIHLKQEDLIPDDFVNNKDIEIEFVLDKFEEREYRISLAFNHQMTNPVFSINPGRRLKKVDGLRNHGVGVYEYHVTIPAHFLNHGLYTIDIYITDENNVLIEKCLQFATFKINRISQNDDVKDDFYFLGGYHGALVPLMDWTMQTKQHSDATSN